MRGAFGLRPRLLAALVLTSAVTLGFAAIALLSPLKSRLRADGTQTVIAAVGASKPGFTDIESGKGQLNKPELQNQVRALELRSSSRVAVLDAGLNQIFNTEPEQPLALTDVRTALRTDKLVHSITNEELQVTQPLHIGGRPYAIVARRRLTFVQESSRVVQDVFLKAAGVGLAVALLLGIGLSATMLRRLERLRDATRMLDHEGPDAPATPVDNSSDEIGELARAFASLQTRLRQQETARRAFVATASHELRTPLASLDGMLELLADDLDASPVDVEDARDRIARAKEQSRRLGTLASDLLDLSRLDAAVILRSEPVELGELARAVAAEFELRAAEHDVELEVVGAGVACWAQGDPGSVARIVRILLDNALRVAPPGTPITLSVEGGKLWAQLEVRDEGPGVVEDERELIFERFQRGSSRGGEGGFGLGLAIGRELAVRMGGSLELTDLSPGAAFQLRLHAVPVAVEA
jgi:signal transduction histidine kinase